jgi:hypothetical protein
VDGGSDRVGETHVPDEAYERVARRFDETALVALALVVGAINGWNRLAVAFRTPAGTYEPHTAPAEAAGDRDERGGDGCSFSRSAWC